jgi:hypothetical protein
MGLRDVMETNFEMSLAGHFSNTRRDWRAKMEQEGFKNVMAECKAGIRYDRNTDG